MRKLIILILAAAALTAKPQTDIRFDLEKYDYAAGSAGDGSTALYDPGNAAAIAIYRQPALAGLGADSISGSSALVQLTYSGENHSGDYLHYRGDRTSGGGALAGGQMFVKGMGMLFGHAYYGREKHRSVYQNSAVRPEDYAPYFVSDSLGIGDVTEEHYLIEGGLSMEHRGWRYGLAMFYEGIDGSKDTQPRLADYSYWFGLTLSAARLAPDWIICLSVRPEINRQSISVSSPVRTFRMLQFYGFGQWNRKESGTGYSYSRDNRILGAGGQVLFCTNPSARRQWNVTATAAYNYRRLRTEETSFKNLFMTSTSRLNHSVMLSGRFSDSFGADFMLTGEETFRSGEENVYERLQQDENLYDYVKAGTNRLYHYSEYSETLLGKATWYAGANHTFSVLAGIGVSRYEESYDSPVKTVRNSNITPRAGVGYAYNSRKNTFDIQLTGCYRKSVDNRFDLNSTGHTQFEEAQAYIPYLLRGEERWSLQASVIAARDIKYGKLGVCIDATCSRRTNAPYVAGWQSDGRHRCFSFEVSAFFIF